MKFIPEVGEPCICVGLLDCPRIKPKYVGSAHVLFDSGGVEFSMLYELFRPIKNPAEIEREELAALIYGCTNLWWRSIRQDSTDLAKMIIDAGWSKQQVKPLSYDEFKSLMREMSFDSYYHAGIYELIKPYIIQGGDKCPYKQRSTLLPGFG